MFLEPNGFLDDTFLDGTDDSVFLDATDFAEKDQHQGLARNAGDDQQRGSRVTIADGTLVRAVSEERWDVFQLV